MSSQFLQKESPRMTDRASQLPIPLSKPWITEDDVSAVLSVLRTPTLSIGPQVRAFEQEIAAYTGVGHGIAVNSGTSGLHLCLAAAEIGPGDEVVTTPFS